MAKKKKTFEELLQEALLPSEEQPYEIPKNWVWSRFELLFKNVTSSKNKLKQKEYLEDGDIPVVDQGENLIGGYTDRKELVYDGNLPVVIFGDHTKCVKYINFNFVQGADGVKVLETNKNVLYVKYAYYLLKNLQLPHKGYSRHYKFLKESCIQLPPLAEQERIVNKIESMFSKIDRAKELIMEAREDFENRKAAILAKVFRGELTKKWRKEHKDVESAEELLKKVEEEKSKVKKKKVEVDEVIEVPYELPEKWKWVRFKKLGSLERGKSKHRPRNDERLFGGQYPFIQTGDVAKADNKIVEHLQTLSEFGFQQSKLFPKGTVCITIAANIGDTGILTYDCCFPDSIVGFIPNQNITLSEFINYYLNVIKKDLEYYAPATAQKNINLAILRRVLIPLPPQEEQKEIVRILDKLLQQESKVEELTKLEEQIELIKKSILNKAFRGELRTNDPEEESALELLKEVLREKAK